MSNMQRFFYDDMVIWSDKQLENRLNNFFDIYDNLIITENVLEKAKKRDPWDNFAYLKADWAIRDQRRDLMQEHCDMMVNQGLAIAYQGIGDVINKTVDTLLQTDNPNLASSVKEEIRDALLKRWSEVSSRTLFQRASKTLADNHFNHLKSNIPQREAAAANRAYRKEIKELKRQLSEARWVGENVKAAE